MQLLTKKLILHFALVFLFLQSSAMSAPRIVGHTYAMYEEIIVADSQTCADATNKFLEAFINDLWVIAKPGKIHWDLLSACDRIVGSEKEKLTVGLYLEPADESTVSVVIDYAKKYESVVFLGQNIGISKLAGFGVDHFALEATRVTGTSPQLKYYKEIPVSVPSFRSIADFAQAMNDLQAASLKGDVSIFFKALENIVGESELTLMKNSLGAANEVAGHWMLNLEFESGKVAKKVIGYGVKRKI
jgi:hypothetical protein